MTRYTICCLLLMAVPAAAEPPKKPGDWWSLRPLAKPALPVLRNPASSIRNPIDAFLGAKRQAAGLNETPEADRRLLIRRLSFDLLGLPPTPAEIAGFIADSAPDAYERLVDRLLASPHFGERMARHWMDAVHFAETHGHDQDRVRPNAWPYRDYLIRGFNSDKPYARFIEEQVAADVLFPGEPELVTALGLLAAGPWDESSLRDIRDDVIDRQVGYYLDRDDMLTTVMATFNSLTVQCARCHDHKFDPIAQEDYYSLQAVFAGVGRGERPIDPDPRVQRRRQELQASLAGIERRDPAVLAALQKPEFQKELAEWETKTKQDRASWTILDIVKLESANGTSFTRMPDGSVFCGGPRPVRDTYTITVRTRLNGITGVRLDVMSDDRLPKHGPGRQDNGNLHLSEFRLLNAAGKGMTPKPVGVKNSRADFDQDGWTIQHALDGNKLTAWGVYPQVGKPHHAVFELAAPLGAGEQELTFILDQLHGGGHVIGRFRLSASNSPQPLRLLPLPGAIEGLLAIPSDKRTPVQQQELALAYLRDRSKSELESLPKPHAVYAAARDFAADGSHRPVAEPRPVHVLKRGDIRKPGAAATPGALACLTHMPARFSLPNTKDEGARRAALARWLSHRDNPLTWRSIVNRVWQYHFGRGLVETPNDFGKMGGAPSHPELLDWLAVEFRDQGGSIKQLTRLMVTSAAYRQGSRHDEKAAKSDADNRLLWRMSRIRLDAETVRDAILAASGRLDLRMGGPSDRHFSLKPGIHVTPSINYREFDWNSPQARRRSVYRFLFRTLPDPFMDCLDAADPSQLTPSRNVSVTPLQALALMNNDFVLVHSKAMADSLRAMEPGQQIIAACERTWGRLPTEDERKEMTAFVAKHGLSSLCRLLFNSNEFLFAD